MVAAVLDTAIVVDLLRGFPPAVRWLGVQQDLLGITPIVWLEVLSGAQSSDAQRRAVLLLRRFERIDFTADDSTRAIADAQQFRLSHGVDPFDCLIAAPCRRLALPLYTRNLKHFGPLLGELAKAPYPV